MMRTNLWGGACALLLLSGVALAQQADWLVGTWSYQSAEAQLTLILYPNGAVEYYVDQGPIHEMFAGSWTSDGRKLDLVLDGEVVSYEATRLAGEDIFLLSGGDLAGRALSFRKTGRAVPRAAPLAAAEVPPADTLDRPEDRAWRARLPLGPRRSEPKLEVVGLPEDPQPRFVVPNALVFLDHQLYLRFAPEGASFWHLFPDGRAFLREPFEGGQRETWGRYHIAGDELQFETDGLDAETLELCEGRRYLQRGALRYGNVLWENARERDD